MLLFRRPRAPLGRTPFAPFNIALPRGPSRRQAPCSLYPARSDAAAMLNKKRDRMPMGAAPVTPFAAGWIDTRRAGLEHAFRCC